MDQVVEAVKSRIWTYFCKLVLSTIKFILKIINILVNSIY